MNPARGTGLRVSAFAAGGGLSLVSLPLLVRHLGVDDFGQYVAVLAVIGVAALAADLGITGIALREYTRAGEADRPALLQGLFGARLGISLVGAVAAIGFALVVGYSGVAVWGTLIACAGLFAQVVADMVVVSLLVDSRFGGAAAIDLSRSATSTALIVVLVLLDAGLIWFFVA